MIAVIVLSQKIQSMLYRFEAANLDTDACRKRIVDFILSVDWKVNLF